MNRPAVIFPALAVVLSMGIGLGYWWGSDGTPAEKAAPTKEREVLYWVAPMDPNYRRDRPGKSPMGMDLKPVYKDEAAPEDRRIVSIDPHVVNNLGVRTAMAVSGVLSRRIETVGYVGYDEDSFIRISPRVEGWIEQLAVKSTGEPVTRGQVLFELYAPALVNAQEEYLAALRSGNRQLEKASGARLQALGVAESELRRLEKTRQVRQRAPVYAKSDGVIAHLAVREGEFVTPAKTVMAIAALDQVWVLAEVLERQSAWVKKGQGAEVAFDASPGQRFAGEVDYVYPELDPKTRALKVRLRFANPDGVLRPNMFARVSITGDQGAAVVHVPAAAVIRGGTTDRVVLSLGDGRFRSQPVVTGMEAGGRVEIRSGLAAGERVVTSAQFLIDSESNRDGALGRYGADADTMPAHTPDAHDHMMEHGQ